MKIEDNKVDVKEEKKTQSKVRITAKNGWFVGQKTIFPRITDQLYKKKQVPTAAAKGKK